MGKTAETFRDALARILLDETLAATVKIIRVYELVTQAVSEGLYENDDCSRGIDLS